MGAAVVVALEGHAVVVDAAGVAEAEDLEAAAVGQDRPIPAHEAMQPSQLGDDIWVIGDIAHVAGADGRPLPMVASVAMQTGRYVARAITRRLAGEPLKPFAHKDQGQMATIGRRRAAVEHPSGLTLPGTPAWFASRRAGRPGSRRPGRRVRSAGIPRSRTVFLSVV